MQTVTDDAAAHVVEGSNGLLLEVDGQIVPNYDATFRPIEEGEVVTGHVVRIDKDEVLVDIGYKSEGVIPANELSIRKAVDPHDEVTLGEEVDALVLTKEDQDGRLIMSKKRARVEKAWRRIEAAAESGEPVEGTVIEVVKGGLIIDLGVRGFLPASLVDIRRVPNLDEYMGTQIECKVIELNRSRNNVVLSRRAVLEEERTSTAASPGCIPCAASPRTSSATSSLIAAAIAAPSRILAMVCPNLIVSLSMAPSRTAPELAFLTESGTTQNLRSGKVSEGREALRTAGLETGATNSGDP